MIGLINEITLEEKKLERLRSLESPTNPKNQTINNDNNSRFRQDNSYNTIKYNKSKSVVNSIALDSIT